ncbi:MAG TPA: DUF6174 domain-containing protein [Gammaproteobacteria bacterium]|nr:DUF6174 domain-containing protein [Gammaproteobacteria bacterium]
MKRVATTIGLIGLLAGVPAPADEAGVARLEAARALWQATQSGDYRYGYQKYCDCNRDEPPVTVVTVTNGEVENVYHLHGDSDREVPARDGSLDLYWTVDDLFDKLAGAYARDAVVRAEYEPDFGYPTSLYIDYDLGVVGDETDLRLTQFEPR